MCAVSFGLVHVVHVFANMLGSKMLLPGVYNLETSFFLSDGLALAGIE